MVRRLRAAGFGALVLCGCVVFDPALYQQSGAAVTLSDRCESMPGIPTVQPETQRLVQVDTTHLGDQYREFASCVGSDLPGNDGFFAVTMRRGETWHFHVDPLDPMSDPALYVLPTCTTLQCSPTGASDVCGPGRAEHFSFRPVTDGVHIVGLDSRLRGGAQYAVTVVRRICGNGVIEHGEPCDDMRPQQDVTCDRCHKVLARAMTTETGVANDDYTNAMILRPDGGLHAFPVTGTLGGCDTDMFSFDLTAGDAVTAALQGNGSACPVGLSLAMQRTDAVVAPAVTAVPSAVTEATATADANCPTLTLAHAARAGTYFLQVTAHPSTATEFPYVLTVDVTHP